MIFYMLRLGVETLTDIHTVVESLCRSSTVNWCLTRSIFIRKKMLKVTQAAKAKKILEKSQTFTKGWQKSMTTHASMMLYFFRFVEKNPIHQYVNMVFTTEIGVSWWWPFALTIFVKNLGYPTGIIVIMKCSDLMILYSLSF